MNFSYKYGRVSSRELPMFFGQYAIKFVEDEKGKPFGELMAEFLSPKNKSLQEIEELNRVLSKEYIVYMEVKSNPTEEDFEEIDEAIKLLDRKSFEYRDSKATTDTEKLKEARTRIFAALRVIGPIMTGRLNEEFDVVNLDLFDATEADIESNIVGLIEITQRLQPTTFILSKEMSENLDKDTPACKTLSIQVKRLKNVFSIGSDNRLVREL